jgi:hypothetical protein
MNQKLVQEELADAAYAAACAKITLDDALLLVRAQYEIEQEDPEVGEDEATARINVIFPNFD